MYYLGLDLGQAHDFTALCIIERLDLDKQKIHHCRHLERFPIGTSYPHIGQHVARMVARSELKGQYRCIVDATGVGRPVVDLLRKEGVSVIPVTITGGSEETSDGLGGYRVPKRDLVSLLQVLLQSGRLLLAEGLPEVRALVDEMLTFQVKITEAANDVYGAWREGQHDDLVLALALAVWYSEKYGRAGDPRKPRRQAPLAELSKWV